MKTLDQRFWEKVEKNGPSLCWEWRAVKDRYGYGRFCLGVDQRGALAHRTAWFVKYGEIPHGKSVLHKCDNPACVNPEHLYLGTQLENMRDMLQKGRNPRSSKTHCKRGHKFTRDNVYWANGGKSRRCKTCVKAAMKCQ